MLSVYEQEAKARGCFMRPAAVWPAVPPLITRCYLAVILLLISGITTLNQ
jgi:hypothetical protein